MEVKNPEVDGKIIVDVSGDFDMKTSRLLQKSLKELVGAKISPIIVNLEKVSYMDSSGLATLVLWASCEARLKRRPRSPDLRGPT